MQYFIEEHHLHYWSYFGLVVVVDYLNRQEDYYLPLDWLDWLNLVYLLDFGYQADLQPCFELDSYNELSGLFGITQVNNQKIKHRFHYLTKRIEVNQTLTKSIYMGLYSKVH